METFGKKLKSLREEKGMTLKDVAQSIKVRESVVQSLENEEWDKLPQRIFVKGFVRAYTKTVDGDETEILDLFNSSYPYEEVAITCPTFEIKPLDTLGRDKHPYKWLLILLILILLAGGGYLLMLYFPHSAVTLNEERKTQVETTVVRPSVGKPAAPMPPTSERSVEPSTVQKHPSTPLKMVQQPSKSTIPPLSEGQEGPSLTKTEKRKAKGNLPAATSSAQPATQTPPETGEAAAIPPPSKDNLFITAKMETWIGLKIGGKLKKQLLLRPGDRYATLIKKPVELLIGNAGGIEIVYQGKKLEHIGKPGQVVRLTLPPKKNP